MAQKCRFSQGFATLCFGAERDFDVKAREKNALFAVCCSISVSVFNENTQMKAMFCQDRLGTKAQGKRFEQKGRFKFKLAQHEASGEVRTVLHRGGTETLSLWAPFSHFLKRSFPKTGSGQKTHIQISGVRKFIEFCLGCHGRCVCRARAPHAVADELGVSARRATHEPKNAGDENLPHLPRDSGSGLN